MKAQKALAATDTRAHALSFTGRKRMRKTFGHIPEVAQMPNLIEVQKQSYDQFLQIHIPAEKRDNSGLQEVFKSVFPIEDFAGKSHLEFVKYEFEAPKYDVEECGQRGITFAAPLKVTLRLVVWDIEEESGLKSIRDIKEQEVYMGDIPLMTENGTFVVNGTERVIVSQMHRSPGVFFDHDQGKTHASGKFLYNSRIIPYRGSWLDFEFDAKDMVYARIDRRRKLPVTTLLMCLDSAETEKVREKTEKAKKKMNLGSIHGMSKEEILNVFYNTGLFEKAKGGWKAKYYAERMRGIKLTNPLVDAKSGKTLADAGTKVTARQAKKWAEDGLENYLVAEDDLLGRYIAKDFINEETGEVICEAGDEITQALLEQLLENKSLKAIPVLDIDHMTVSAHIRNTLAADKNFSRDEALIDIYRVMRPGEPPTLEAADALFNSLFFDSERYDLSSVGRVKLNARLNLDAAQS
jgi:DNA-directed RNA polymerase subunit beta